MSLTNPKKLLLVVPTAFATLIALLIWVHPDGQVSAQEPRQTPTPTPTPTRLTLTDIPLRKGFNNLAALWPPNTAAERIAAAVDPPGALNAIWKFDAAQGRWLAYSPKAPGAASDLRTAGVPDALWFDVTQDARLKFPCTITVTTEPFTITIFCDFS